MVVINRETGRTFHQTIAGGLPTEAKDGDKTPFIQLDATTPEELLYKCFLNFAACLEASLTGNVYEKWQKRFIEDREKIKSLLNMK